MDGWDWSRGNVVLAREYGVTAKAVENWRRRLGKPRVSFVGRYDFSAVDWRQRDAAIARLIGCSREAVRQRRKKSGSQKKQKAAPPAT